MHAQDAATAVSLRQHATIELKKYCKRYVNARAATSLFWKTVSIQYYFYFQFENAHLAFDGHSLTSYNITMHPVRL